LIYCIIDFAFWNIQYQFYFGDRSLDGNRVNGQTTCTAPLPLFACVDISVDVGEKQSIYFKLL
jgi:hypothetical protein